MTFFRERGHRPDACRAPRYLRVGALPMLAPMGLSALLVLGGCTSYREQPIDAETLERTWRALDPISATAAVLDRDSQTVEDSNSTKKFDLRDGITLAEAEVTALFFNPSIRATRMQIGIPEAEASHAKLWEDPGLDVDGEYILADVDEPLVLGAGLSVTIPISGRLGVSKQLAEARVAASQAAAVGAEWALLTTLRREWVTLAAAEARIATLQESAKTLQSLLDLAPKFRAAQVVTVVDERWLLVQHKLVIDALQQATAKRDQGAQGIVAYLGLHPDHPWQLLTTPSEIRAEPGSIPNNQATNLQRLLHDPSLRQVLAAYQVAEQQLHLEVRKQYPDLTIGLGGGIEDGDPRVALGLSLLPIPVWNRNKQGIAMATVERDVVAQQIAMALQNVIHRHRQARTRLQAAANRLLFFETELVPLADAQVADALRLTSLGELNLALLADAVELSRTTSLDLIEVQTAHRLASLELKALGGPQFNQLNNEKLNGTTVQSNDDKELSR